MRVLSRKRARQLGLKTYFTGKPCPAGHVTKRSVLHKACCICLLEQAKRYQRAKRARFRALNPLPVRKPVDKNAYNRAWRARNLERARAYHRAYYALHSEKQIAATVDWTRRNRHKQRASKLRRRARENGADGITTHADLAEIMTKQDGICFYCDTDITQKYSADHFIPLSRGGTNWPENIRLACRSCNSRKGDKMPWEFIPKIKRYGATHERERDCNDAPAESTRRVDPNEEVLRCPRF